MGEKWRIRNENKELKKEIEKWEREWLIVVRLKPQQGVETQIDRLADEFQKKESSEEIHELERDGDQNSGGSGVMSPDDEYMDHLPIPQVQGGRWEGQEERPPKKKKTKMRKIKISRIWIGFKW